MTMATREEMKRETVRLSSMLLAAIIRGEIVAPESVYPFNFVHSGIKPLMTKSMRWMTCVLKPKLEDIRP
jgi:hypothetical protein